MNKVPIINPRGPITSLVAPVNTQVRRERPMRSAGVRTNITTFGTMRIAKRRRGYDESSDSSIPRYQ